MAPRNTPMNELLGNIPPITRLIAGSAFITSTLCSLEFISKFDLFFNLDLILNKHEYWRVITTFTYFGEFNIWVCMHLYILFTHCKLLEENSFQGRSVDFLYFVLLTSSIMLLCAPLLGLAWLSECLFMCLMYVMSKRNRHEHFALIGLPMVRIPATYVPYLILILGVTKERILGIVIGHIYFFFEDVYPRLPTSSGTRIFKTPHFLQSVFRMVMHRH